MPRQVVSMTGLISIVGGEKIVKNSARVHVPAPFASAGRKVYFLRG
jgi:hypothetical protein